MQYGKVILIRALDCIAAEGYVTKDAALIAGTKSTSQKVAASLALQPELIQAEIEKFESTADQIISWIRAYAGNDQYLNSCKTAIDLADSNPEKTYGYICSLPVSYNRQLVAKIGLDKVTKPNDFAQTAGKQLNATCEVINIQTLDGYKKISLVDDSGHLITYTVNDTVKTASIKRGDKVAVEGKVFRNKLTTPCETVISRPKIHKIKV